MSRQVTVSDIFEEQLEEMLVAAMKYVQRPGSTDRHYEYVQANLYEYDTNIQSVVDRAVKKALSR